MRESMRRSGSVAEAMEKTRKLVPDAIIQMFPSSMTGWNEYYTTPTVARTERYGVMLCPFSSFFWGEVV